MVELQGFLVEEFHLERELTADGHEISLMGMDGAGKDFKRLITGALTLGD